METNCDYTGEVMEFSSDERKWINKIRKLATEYPDDVRIVAQPETNDGCIYAKLPAEWLKIAPKRRVNMTDEQRVKIAERLKMTRKTIGRQADGGM